MFLDIQLLEYTIPPCPCPLRHKKSRWLYLGNKESYRISSSVKRTIFFRVFQIFKKILLDFQIGLISGYISGTKKLPKICRRQTTRFFLAFQIFAWVTRLECLKGREGRSQSEINQKLVQQIFYIILLHLLSFTSFFGYQYAVPNLVSLNCVQLVTDQADLFDGKTNECGTAGHGVT